MSPKINNIGWAQGHVRKSPNHENEGFEVHQIENYKFKLKQSNTTEIKRTSFA